MQLLCVLASGVCAAALDTAEGGTKGSGCSGWAYHDEGTGKTRCYHLVTDPNGFFAAELQCSLQHHGHLTAPGSENENTFLKLKLLEHYGHDNSRHEVWLGAFRSGGA